MSDILQTPPQTDSAHTQARSLFFTVAPSKLMVMMILTNGLYSIHWFYMNWKLYRRYSGRSIWAMPRALFPFFHLPSLFYKIDGTFKAEGKGAMPYWAASAVMCYLLPFLPSLVVDLTMLLYSVATENTLVETSSLSEFAIIVSGFLLQCLVFLRVQRFINTLNDDPQGLANNHYSYWNYAWIVVGVGQWSYVYYWVCLTYP